MAVELARRLDPACFLGSVDLDRTAAKQAERPTGCRDDGAFEPARAEPAVDDEGDAVAEAGGDMLRAGGADFAAGVGGRRGKRFAGRGEERLHRRVRGDAQCNRRQAGGDDGGDPTVSPVGDDQGQRPGPMGFGER